MPENMNDGTSAAPVTTTDGGAPLGASTATPPPDDTQQTQSQPPAAARAEPKVVTVPTTAMKRIKDEEFTRGRQAALDELSQGAGFGSSADLISALQKLKSPATPAPAAQPQTPPAPADNGLDPEKELAVGKDARREEGRYQRQLEKVLTERNKYASSAQQWQAKAREAQAEADAVRAEMHLRTIAASVGVQDIDYAITLFSREVERLTPEQAEKFDEKVYFETLRKTKPLLFGEAVVPATTGTGMGGAPTPPKPGAVAAQNGQNGRVDARKLDPRQYAAELAKRGINPHGS